MERSVIVDLSQMFETYSLREEIAEWERKHRPFPPRSGSVSKPWLDRPDDPWLMMWPSRRHTEQFIESWKAEQAYKNAPRRRIRTIGSLMLRPILDA